MLHALITQLYVSGTITCKYAGICYYINALIELNTKTYLKMLCKNKKLSLLQGTWFTNDNIEKNTHAEHDNPQLKFQNSYYGNS